MYLMSISNTTRTFVVKKYILWYLVNKVKTVQNMTSLTMYLLVHEFWYSVNQSTNAKRAAHIEVKKLDPSLVFYFQRIDAGSPSSVFLTWKHPHWSGSRRLSHCLVKDTQTKIVRYRSALSGVWSTRTNLNGLAKWPPMAGMAIAIHRRESIVLSRINVRVWWHKIPPLPSLQKSQQSMEAAFECHSAKWLRSGSGGFGLTRGLNIVYRGSSSTMKCFVRWIKCSHHTMIDFTFQTCAKYWMAKWMWSVAHTNYIMLKIFKFLRIN